MYSIQFGVLLWHFFFFTNFTEIMALQQGGLHVARATNMWKLRINENS